MTIILVKMGIFVSVTALSVVLIVESWKAIVRSALKGAAEDVRIWKEENDKKI